MTLNERLGGKGYKPRKDYAGRRVSGDWENSDRGGGHKSIKRAGGKVEKKSPTYLAYVKNKNKALNNSYEPEGEFLSYEEVEVFVESLVEQGYTEEQILLELDRKGLGPVILGKGLELGMGAIKNTIKFGRATRGVVNRAVSDTKLLKKIDTTARTLRGKSGNTFKGFKDKAGSIARRVTDKLSRTDIKSNTPSVSRKPVEVLGGAATKDGGKTLTNVTPIGDRITAATNKVKVGGVAAAGAGAGGVVVTNKNKVEPPKTKTFQNRISGNGKNEVNPTKNPVVKKAAKDAGKAAWIKKTSRSAAATARTSGGKKVWTDDERWNTQLKHRAWKASRQKTKVNEEGKSLFSTPHADKLKNIEKWKLNNDKLYKKFGWTLNKAHYEPEGEMIDESVKDELLANARKAHKKAKNFKKWRNDAEKARQSTLKPGEVRWMDKKTGKWKTNKPG